MRRFWDLEVAEKGIVEVSEGVPEVTHRAAWKGERRRVKEGCWVRRVALSV